MNKMQDTHYRRNAKWLGPRPAISLILTGCLLAAAGVTWADAQQYRSWSIPLSLSRNILDETGAPADSFDPSLAVDPWGEVHAIWSARTLVQSNGIGDTVFYAHWKDGQWSEPVDILNLGLTGTIVQSSKLVADRQGWLHLVWVTNDFRMWYSRALAAEAGMVRAWSQPMEITDALGANLSVGVETNGTLHMVFCSTSQEAGVYYTNSADGLNWSPPVKIGPSIRYNCAARLALDSRDRVHVAWAQWWAGDIPAYYTRSDDHGLTWLPLMEVDRKDSRYQGDYAPGRISILAIGQDEVHLVWYGAPWGQRWHRWSADGGVTWSPAAQIDPDLRMFTNPAALAADSLGRLHMLTMGAGSTGVFGPNYATWYKGQWSPLTLIANFSDERSALAITHGNLLVAVWDAKFNNTFSLWTSQVESDAPAVSPGARPTPSLELTAIAPTEISQSQATGAATDTAPGTILLTPPSVGFSEQQILMLIIFPILVVLSLALLWRWMRLYTQSRR